jgi:putative Ca2+/H+ antiporter (TMEM165/GDT1 family)
MGDKTQLLALMLVAKYRQPWTILFGILVATILNHAFASWFGIFVSSYFSAEFLKYSLSLIFILFGFWMLIPDKESESPPAHQFGVLITTVISFFFAEMGDKTQLATIALGAQHNNFVEVTIGTTLGMLASNALVLIFGEKILKYFPMRWVRVFSCGLFILCGLWILT